MSIIAPRLPSAITPSSESDWGHPHVHFDQIDESYPMVLSIL
jgi:hypothetical protein